MFLFCNKTGFKTRSTACRTNIFIWTFFWQLWHLIFTRDCIQTEFRKKNCRWLFSHFSNSYHMDIRYIIETTNFLLYLEPYISNNSILLVDKTIISPEPLVTALTLSDFSFFADVACPAAVIPNPFLQFSFEIPVGFQSVPVELVRDLYSAYWWTRWKVLRELFLKVRVEIRGYVHIPEIIPHCKI